MPYLYSAISIQCHIYTVPYLHNGTPLPLMLWHTRLQMHMYVVHNPAGRLWDQVNSIHKLYSQTQERMYIIIIPVYAKSSMPIKMIIFTSPHHPPHIALYSYCIVFCRSILHELIIAVTQYNDFIPLSIA